MRLKPMAGINFSDYPETILSGKLWRMSEKIDGERRLFHKDGEGHVTAYSNTGKEDPWLNHIFEFLEEPWFPSNTVYDCELVDRELYYQNVESFILRTETSSKASQQFPDNKKDLIAVCFDLYTPHGDLRRAEERDQELYHLFSRGRPEDPVVRVPIFGNIFGTDSETLKLTMDKVMRKNGEGLMLLDMDSIYIPGRSKNLIKVKRVKEFIGKVIDLEMGRPGTKIEGMVAVLICEVKGCTLPVRVGSGFSNEERIRMTKESPMGKRIEIEAFSYSKNRNGGVSLSFPIFKRFAS